ncbi:MAG: hypothetical protein B6U89_04695 [Desulfurococcales archaeon ex4484_58]|nr:MAG: hypothetical protein B6U89_04695 [Desulfurococcales archaeon ex4484_58]
MAWFGGWGWRGGHGWRGGGWRGPWPGKGPFSYLPPWQRPGWIFGRGSCWWLMGWPWRGYWYRPWYWGGWWSWYPYQYYYMPPYGYPIYPWWGWW